MAAPVITILSFSRARISAVSGLDYCDVVFTSNQDLVDWEARAGGAGLGQGLLVGKASPIRETWADLDARGWTWATLDARNHTWNDLIVVLPAGNNILLNPDISHSSWSKGYNTNIVYTTDGPVAGATVATFQDADTDGTGYWYCYTDQAPQVAEVWYLVEIWVNSPTATIQFRCYTADNSETGRISGSYQTVAPADGWKKLQWLIQNPAASASDSLSFSWSGLTSGASLKLSAPSMTPVGTFRIDNEELTNGDITYRIDTYGKNAGKEWSVFGT